MSIRRITISVPEAVAGRVRKAAGSQSVSRWVTDAIEERLSEAELEREWQKFYAEVRPHRDDVRRADAIFKRLTRRTRRRGAA